MGIYELLYGDSDYWCMVLVSSTIIAYSHNYYPAQSPSKNQSIIDQNFKIYKTDIYLSAADLHIDKIPINDGIKYKTIFKHSRKIDFPFIIYNKLHYKVYLDNKKINYLISNRSTPIIQSSKWTL